MEDKKFKSEKYSTDIGTEWMINAECLGEDPSLFHPEKEVYKDEYGQPTEQVKKALAFCKVCPVNLECLTYALEIERKPNTAGRYGIWASTPEQRKAYEESREAKRGDT